jgi:hypothetical protein
MVNDATPAKIDHRIDLVLASPAKGITLKSTKGWITGNKATNRDKATGLWPSDHAGVVVQLTGFGKR